MISTRVIIDKPIAKKEESVFDRVSPSKLNTWASCPHKFKLKYLDKVEVPGSGARHLGSSAHSALEAYNRARWLGNPATLELMLDTFATAWTHADKIQFKDGKEAGQLCEQGYEMLRLYYAIYPPEEGVKPKGVEVHVECELVDLITGEILTILHGIIDLIQAGIITDYKTTARSMSNDMVALSNEVQLTAYSILYRNTSGKKERGLEIKSLIRTKVPKLLITSLSPREDFHVKRLINLVKAFVAGTKSGLYPACPGLNCMMCDYREYCR